jgi:colicin import membrane protein
MKKDRTKRAKRKKTMIKAKKNNRPRRRSVSKRRFKGGGWTSEEKAVLRKADHDEVIYKKRQLERRIARELQEEKDTEVRGLMDERRVAAREAVDKAAKAAADAQAAKEAKAAELKAFLEGGKWSDSACRRCLTREFAEAKTKATKLASQAYEASEKAAEEEEKKHLLDTEW